MSCVSRQFVFAVRDQASVRYPWLLAALRCPAHGCIASVWVHYHTLRNARLARVELSRRFPATSNLAPTARSPAVSPPRVPAAVLAVLSPLVKYSNNNTRDRLWGTRQARFAPWFAPYREDGAKKRDTQNSRVTNGQGVPVRHVCHGVLLTCVSRMALVLAR